MSAKSEKDTTPSISSEANLPDPAQAHACPDCAQSSSETSDKSDAGATLDDKRKNALLRYMGILFCVAFLLVLLSSLIQMRDSRLTISELSQASNNALQNAEALQDMNRELMDENSALTEENNQLQNQLDDTQKSLEDRKAQLDSLGSQLERVESERQEELETYQKQLEAYEVLLIALQAYWQEDTETLQATLESLKELSEYLSETGIQLYQSLLAENQPEE